MQIDVTKASGMKEPFSLQKLRNSLLKSHVPNKEIETIIQTLLPKLYQGISTKKIYSEAFRLLKKQPAHHAARYYLKKGLMELGPSGFPFERFVGEIFKLKAYQVEVGITLQGKCVTHEVDVVATNDTEIILMECKYKNQAGLNVDIKTPLYIQSRFEDILANGLLDKHKGSFSGWITTNSKFSTDAIMYGKCKGLKLLSWDYPENFALKDLIDQHCLYPLTCLGSLTLQEKQWLLAKNYVLVKEIFNNKEILLKAGVKENRLKAIYLEGSILCQN
jgi:hypothetical protein